MTRVLARIDHVMKSAPARRALARLLREGHLRLVGRFFGRPGDARHTLIAAHTAGALTRAALARIGTTGRGRIYFLCLTARGRSWAGTMEAPETP